MEENGKENYDNEKYVKEECDKEWWDKEKWMRIDVFMMWTRARRFDV